MMTRGIRAFLLAAGLLAAWAAPAHAQAIGSIFARVYMRRQLGPGGPQSLYSPFLHPTFRITSRCCFLDAPKARRYDCPYPISQRHHQSQRCGPLRGFDSWFFGRRRR